MSALTMSDPNRQDREFYRDLGARLRRTREAKGWSLARLEEITEMGRLQGQGRRFGAVAVGSYERGERRPAPDTLYALADLYEVPVSTFLPDDPSELQVMVALADVIRMLSGLASDSPNLLVPAPRVGEVQA